MDKEQKYRLWNRALSIAGVVALTAVVLKYGSPMVSDYLWTQQT